MGYNLAGGYCNCWKCGFFNTVKVFMQLTGEPYNKARLLIGDVVKERGFEVQTTGTLVIPKGVGPLKSVHKNYLISRGFDPEEVSRIWGVQGIGLQSKLAWRLFIPITYLGEPVSWTTRSVHAEADVRYVSAAPNQEAMKHKRLLYGEEYCKKHCVIVHEGPIDVWANGPGSVCTCGVGVSREQVRRLSKYLRRVICFDSEQGAQERARQLCDMLEPFPGETFNITLDSKDVATAPKRDIRKIRKMFLKG